MRKVCSIVLAAALLAVSITGCGDVSDGKQDAKGQDSSTATETVAQTETPETETPESGTPDEESLTGKHHIKIKIKKYGTISVELDADTAPITVTNFINLANDKFYDGLTFHRIISGFMIQGGDPLGNGKGGSEQTIKGEFSDNGVENNLKHVRGTISMARSQDYNSASSQFFIMHEDSPSLDGQYAAFGTVTDGMEIVDKICEDTPVTDDNGTVEAQDQPVIKKIKVID